MVRKAESKSKKSIAEIGELNEIDQLFLTAQESAINTYNLADETLFSVTIGKRVLKTELAPTGLYPVYSANVFTPFGFINKLLIKDFSNPSVIWGIDGDWMVSYMPKDMPFYPTDHCGVLRVISSDIHPRYLAWLLEKAGAKQEFSRSRRASVDRIKSLSVSVPSYAVQQSTVEKVFEIEQKIEKAKQLLVDLNNKRKGV
ncbi:MAG: restriction endonuclease subunit S [Bacillota bacterium]